MSFGSDETSGSGTRYETVRVLARGGMGSVEIAAVQKGGFRRLFALKRLRPELLTDERATQMLVEEGRIAGLLRHPNVVHVLDVGVDAQGPFLVMELVRGISAFDLFRWSKQSQRPLDVQLVMRLMEQAASGLHAAHELRGDDQQPIGLVHRDVSPQNIMIGFDGVARVTDFGIAKALDVETHTTTGLLKGKAGYMSPEQLRFEPVDRRADLFALGIVLFELTIARRLYREENVALSARRILHEPAPDLGAERPGLPAGLVELCFELLAKTPGDRPATAKEVATRLAELVAEDVVARGPFDVEAFLATEFADRLAETAAWSKLAEDHGQIALSASMTPALGPPTELDAGLEVLGSRSSTDPIAPITSGRRPWLLGTATLGVVALAAAWWWTASRSFEAPRPSAGEATAEIAVRLPDPEPSGPSVDGAPVEVPPIAGSSALEEASPAVDPHEPIDDPPTVGTEAHGGEAAPSTDPARRTRRRRTDRGTEGREPVEEVW